MRTQGAALDLGSRRAAEALMLEIRMLAASYGLKVALVEVAPCAPDDEIESLSRERDALQDQSCS